MENEYKATIVGLAVFFIGVCAIIAVSCYFGSQFDVRQKELLSKCIEHGGTAQLDRYGSFSNCIQQDNK